jgi:antitoxin component YwqK of YwqJK toxin-antitoxin module
MKKKIEIKYYYENGKLVDKSKYNSFAQHLGGMMKDPLMKFSKI